MLTVDLPGMNDALAKEYVRVQKRAAKAHSDSYSEEKRKRMDEATEEMSYIKRIYGIDDTSGTSNQDGGGGQNGGQNGQSRTIRQHSGSSRWFSRWSCRFFGRCNQRQRGIKPSASKLCLRFVFSLLIGFEFL